MVTASSRKTVIKVKKRYVIGAFQAILPSRKGFNKKFKNIIFSRNYFLMKKHTFNMGVDSQTLRDG
jgi:hypothetical protein